MENKKFTAKETYVLTYRDGEEWKQSGLIATIGSDDKGRRKMLIKTSDGIIHSGFARNVLSPENRAKVRAYEESLVRK